jgi:hypothetical protein
LDAWPVENSLISVQSGPLSSHSGRTEPGIAAAAGPGGASAHTALAIRPAIKFGQRNFFAHVTGEVICFTVSPLLMLIYTGLPHGVMAPPANSP